MSDPDSTEPKNPAAKKRRLEQQAERLTKHCLALPEQLMRTSYLSSKLTAMTDSMVMELLNVILKKSAERIMPYRELMRESAKFDLILVELGPYRTSRIYHAAVRKNYAEVVNFFSRYRPMKKDEGDEDLFLNYGFPDKTLGERRQMARSVDHNTIDRLGYDIDPEVVRRLLINPRITERDVVKIASRRPNKPQILDVIFNSPKWLARYEVKLALIRNPYASPRIALAILPSLMIHDIKDVAFDENLHPKVVEFARMLLKKKGLARAEVTQEEEP